MAKETDGQPREGETPEAKEDQTDYKVKLAEVEAQKQAEIDALKREMKQKEEMLDSLTPYVDWAAASGQAPANTPEAEDGDKRLDERLRKIESKYDASLAAIQFRQDNPDLKAYEKTLVGPAVKRLFELNPRKSREEILDMAAREVRDFLKAEREKGKAEAQARETARKEEVDKASGLGSAGETAPDSTEGGETREEYMASRRKYLEQMKQPARVVG